MLFGPLVWVRIMEPFFEFFLTSCLKLGCFGKQEEENKSKNKKFFFFFNRIFCFSVFLLFLYFVFVFEERGVDLSGLLCLTK